MRKIRTKKFWIIWQCLLSSYSERQFIQLSLAITYTDNEMNSGKNFWKKITGKKESSDTPTDYDPQSYSVDRHDCSVTEHALNVAKRIRGDSPPTIFLHGIMPRSGTVFVGNLIKLHPDLAAYPGEIWEIPFLCSTGSILDFQDSFFSAYSMNDDKIGRNDFMRMFGAAFIRYLNDFDSSKRLFMKEPRVRFLNYFFDQFPDENLVLLVRDGRDVVSSTIRSWPEKDFESVCEEWDKAAKICLSFTEHHQDKESQWLLSKFEEILDAPSDFVRQVCTKFSLDQSRYPFDEVDLIPVQGSSMQKKDGQVTWEPIKKDADFNPIGRWSDWTDQQKDRFKLLAGESLITLGYEDSMDW